MNNCLLRLLPDWQIDEEECSMGTWLTGLISAVDSEILTTAPKQMGAITDISPFSSSLSVLVNICVKDKREEIRRIQRYGQKHPKYFRCRLMLPVGICQRV